MTNFNDIAKHEWLTNKNEECDDKKFDNYDVPLIKRKVLSESVHNEVIINMIKGNIAPQDEVLK